MTTSDKWTAERREDGGWAAVAPADNPSATHDLYKHVQRPDGRNTIPFAVREVAEEVAAEANGER